MYYYKNHLNSSIFHSENPISDENLYCETCDDSDWPLYVPEGCSAEEAFIYIIQDPFAQNEVADGYGGHSFVATVDDIFDTTFAAYYMAPENVWEWLHCKYPDAYAAAKEVEKEQEKEMRDEEDT